MRKIVSLTLILSFLVELAAGLVLYIAPLDRVAYWADWTFLGLTKDQWDAAHINIGFLMAAAGFLFLWLHREAVASLLKGKGGGFSRPFLVALCLTVFVFAGTLLHLPPMQQVIDFSGFIKNQMSEAYGEPPYGHAELSSLETFCRRMGIDFDKAMEALGHKSIVVESPQQTIKDISRKNGLAPGGVYEAVKFARELGASPSQRLPMDPPPGLGKRKLSDICEEYELDILAMMKKLKASGVAAKPAMTLKDVAQANDLLPIDIYDAMRSDKPVRPKRQAAPRPTPDDAGAAPGTPGRPGPANATDIDAGDPAPGANSGMVRTIIPPPGLGRMMLKDFCREFDLPQNLALARLKAKNIMAFSDSTFRELALENDSTPEDIMRIVTSQ